MPKWRDLALEYLKVLALQTTSPIEPELGPALLIDPVTGPASDVLSNAPPFVPPGYTESFEVNAPIETPPGVKPCVVDLGMHAFAFSYGLPWITKYNPPTECGNSWSKVRMTWSAYVAGRQFDRIIHVWIDGAEVFRGISHEPSRNGIWWQAEADLTSYAPLLKKSNLTVVAACDNVVDSTYTGIINVNLKLEFYPTSDAFPAPTEVIPDVLIPLGTSSETYGYSLLQGDGKSADFRVSSLPKNIRRAEIEYFVSNHAHDEFYYTNVPDSYANPDNGIYGKGPYKELQFFIDGQLAGVDWPSPVLYTGAMNPLLYRPFVAPMATKLPTFKFDVTAFAGLLSDDKEHTITLNVTNQTPGCLWYVDGILRLWLDENGTQTTSVGKIQVDTGSITFPDVELKVDPSNNDANITTTLRNRKFRIQGSILLSSTQQTINTKVESRLIDFTNRLSYTDNTNNLNGLHDYAVVKTVERHIVDDTTKVLSPLEQFYSHRNINFKFALNYKPLNGNASDFIVNTTISQKWTMRDTKRKGNTSKNTQTLSVRNYFDGDGYFGTRGGEAATHHMYQGRVVPEYPGRNSGCYLREVFGFNRTVVKNRVKQEC
ncbi:hypothetical protein HDU67_009628 [Dinochytrium kinnereticum]|nr:hypothetical protein HDU67_009628 [Dinochytrium kinnereticum]